MTKMSIIKLQTKPTQSRSSFLLTSRKIFERPCGQNVREICPIWLQNLPRQHLHVHAPLSMCLSLSSPSPLLRSLSWKFLSSRCGTALKPLFLAAQPSPGRPTPQDLLLPPFGRLPHRSERASHKIGIPETFLGFCAVGRPVAHWAGQPARWGGRDKRGEEGGGRRRKEGREMGDR